MKISGFYFFYIMVAIFSLPISCKKEYVRPDHYAIDLFANERNEQQKKILSVDEATEKSLFVIKSNTIELINSSKINAKTIYIYKINSGRILKPSEDSLQFPVRIISNYDLKLKSKKDSSVIYLIDPLSYKLLIKEFEVTYQTLPSVQGS